jgi:chemosensory pili system protein ChpA (sensor histidine kinase/response regulator)
MSEDKELQVRLQFLEEAREYIDTMESGLLGLGSGKVKSPQMDAILRAAHSIKGGAAMMGFQELSHLAHRLEDSFKVLKIGKPEAVNGELEQLLLSGVDFLRQIIVFNRKQAAIDEYWLQKTVNPIFEQLHERLGDPQPEDATALLSAELGEDMSSLIFQTEVEDLLSKLESILANPETENLEEALLSAAQELSGLGEMLELTAFAELCQSTIEHLETLPEKARQIAEVALQEWRKSQALVLIGQVDILPNTLELEFSEDDFFGSSLDDELPNTTMMQSLFETNNLEQEALDLFSSVSESLLAEVETVEIAEPEPIVSAFSVTAEGTNTSENNYVSLTPSLPNPETSTDLVTEKTIRVNVKQLEQLSDLFGEIAIERNGLNLRLKSLHNLVGLLGQRIKTLEQSNFKLRIAYDKVATEVIANSLSNINVEIPQQSSVSTENLLVSDSRPDDYFDSLEMDRYNDIHLLSQEVMETVVQIQEVAKDIETSVEDTEKKARELNRTSQQMQSTMTRVRMRPISDLLSRFPRALRDLEIQYGKKVNLQIKGAATLIDRSILESLNDPLLHLFRNAFDHGIELPKQRLAANKPERGVITIAANHRGNHTVITISDDGGGIDIKKIKHKAMSIGITAEDLAKAKETDLLDLIFEPGFSTADKVTDLSGRGVGMDVVKTNIEAIEGKIQVDTQLGVGTTFTISVPFTLSVVRVLLVQTNGMLLAFPVNAIEEMLVLEPEMVLEAAGQEVLNWDGTILRLIRLEQWLNMSSNGYNPLNDLEANPAIERPTVLIASQNNDLVGIQVERYWQEIEVTIRSVEGNIALPPGFSGCTVLGDGRVVPLVDVISLLNWIENDRQTGFIPSKIRRLSPVDRTSEPSIEVSSLKKMVMVVDDSINVRRFLAMTLEKANYRVEQAKDGQDALEKLDSGIIPDAVICDIEMPRLDGFGFLSRARAKSQYKKIPIIMLTSRSGEKHRKLAMNLGATDYFSKPFKEQQLLSTLETLTK